MAKDFEKAEKKVARTAEFEKATVNLNQLFKAAEQKSLPQEVDRLQKEIEDRKRDGRAA